MHLSIDHAFQLFISTLEADVPTRPTHGMIPSLCIERYGRDSCMILPCDVDCELFRHVTIPLLLPNATSKGHFSA